MASQVDKGCSAPIKYCEEKNRNLIFLIMKTGCPNRENDNNRLNATARVLQEIPLPHCEMCFGLSDTIKPDLCSFSGSDCISSQIGG